ncbi:hypothetical protein N0V87_005479 [Didymella glomerata]|uniref:Uncharacterized protein n=1 Tax=Didymella glomerata TaxID=749621 RepID=A0A9W8WYE9_9PLEO|nr:hypothetical protein N0V87_005479 [Didymella glomerata]
MINLTIFHKSTPHALRAVSLLSFIPAFPILLIAGIALEQVNPAIGLVPLFFSSLYSAILLSNEKKCGCQASGLTGTPFHFILDFLIGTGLLIGGFEFGKSYSFGSGANRGSKNGYAPLLDGDGEPRVSAEEQANEGENMA